MIFCYHLECSALESSRERTAPGPRTDHGQAFLKPLTLTQLASREVSASVVPEKTIKPREARRTRSER